jgi:predicted GTPase
LTDVLPATSEVERYELQPEGVPTRLVLLDTVGYGHTGPKEDQLRTTRETAQQSDLLLLVLHARNPARQADAAMLKALRDWYADRPDLRMPPDPPRRGAGRSTQERRVQQSAQISLG